MYWAHRIFPYVKGSIPVLYVMSQRTAYTIKLYFSNSNYFDCSILFFNNKFKSCFVFQMRKIIFW